MPDLWTATLNPRGPNYDEWIKILGTSNVPLVSPRWSLADLSEEKNVQVYLVNLRALTLTQRARLVGTLAQKFGSPIYDIEAEINRVGFPIRADDVLVSYSTRASV